MAINFTVIPGCPSNVVFRYDDSAGTLPPGILEGIKLKAPLTDVILPLARRHPDWRFVAHYTDARYFTVSKGSEVLGEIGTGYRDYGTVAKIKNARISAKIARGDGMMSSKPDKVRKLVEQYFVPKTADERINSKRIELASQFDVLVYTADQKARMRERQVVPALLYALLKEHRDTVLSVATSLSITSIEELEAAYDKAALMNKLNRARTSTKGVVGVVRDGDAYWVSRDGMDKPAVSYTDDTLPLQLRTNIGLLKLAEQGEPHEGIGVRVGPDLFLTVYNEG
jgi:hypothetical protein